MSVPIHQPFAELSSAFSLAAYRDEKKLARRQTFVFSATLTMAHAGPRRVMKKKKVKFTSDQKLGESRVKGNKNNLALNMCYSKS